MTDADRHGGGRRTWGEPALSSSASHARTKSRLRPAVIAASVLALSTALPAAALASSPPSTVEVSATLLLRTPDAAATNALATAAGLPRTERLSRLAALLPSAATKASALDDVAGLGLTVDHTTPWSVVVHGTADEIAALTASGRHSGAVTQSPSLVPAVSSVISGGPVGAFKRRSLGEVAGPDFRTAYNASSAAPTGPNAPVIATIQLAGWDPTDLSDYAYDSGLPQPTASTVTAISVDSAGDPTNVTDDSVEDALDQESIYSVDPYANQRIYFAQNKDDSYVDAFLDVATDALASPSIMAVSSSWGECETNANLDPGYLNAMHQVLGDVLSAGVTVFAASGDDGSNDCSNGTNAVDYPASDPYTVGVGGTTLDTAGPVETAWGDSNGGSFQGSGGGASTTWPKPAYQDAVAPTSTTREVPDIAANASDLSPFVVDFEGEQGDVWGTSLASPISAALLTAELGSRGYTNGGVGDIHAALYSTESTSFRDITSGTNGTYNAGPGYDMVTGLGAPNWHAIVDQLTQAPVVHAPAAQTSRTIRPTVTTPGLQSFTAWASGTGTPPACSNNTKRPASPPTVIVPKDGVYQVWVQGYVGFQRCFTGSTTVAVDGVGPAVSLGSKSAAGGKSVAYTWGVSDKVSGVSAVTVSVLRNGKKIWSGHSTGSGRIALKGQPGSSYQLVVVARDNAGNATTTKRSIGIAYDDSSLKLSAGWSKAKSKSAYGGALVKSAKTGATARIKAYGSMFSLVTSTSPTGGLVEVFLDGRHVRDVSLYSKGTKAQVVVKLATSGSIKVHSLVLVVKGAKAAHAKGVVVTVDGLLAI